MVEKQEASSLEEWRAVPGYEGLYAVSSLGRIRSFYRDKRFLSTKGKDESGYPVVSLTKDGKRHTYTLHRLVCRAFHGEPGTARNEVAHLDGSQTNCRSGNLKWATKLENEAHKLQHGTRTSERFSRLTTSQVIEMKGLLEIRPRKWIADKFGVSRGTVDGIATGKRWGGVTPQKAADHG